MCDWSLYDVLGKLMFGELKERMGPALGSLTTCTEEMYLTLGLNSPETVAQVRFGEAFIS